MSNNPSKAEEYLRRAEEIDESSLVTGHSKGDAGRLVLMGPSDVTEIGHRESVGILLPLLDYRRVPLLVLLLLMLLLVTARSVV